MNNKGFIATSLIYSFFLIFVTLFLGIIADYLQDKVLLNTIEKGIKEDLNSSMGIQDFEVGDILYFETPGNLSDLYCDEGTDINVSCNNKIKNTINYKICSLNYEKLGGANRDEIYLSSEVKTETCNPTITIKLDGNKFEINNDTVTDNITITGIKGTG